MTITVSVPDRIAMQAESEGLSVESYIERILEMEAERRQQPKWIRFGPGPLTLQEAARDIRDLCKGVTLGGLKIKDLIHEGHKY